MKTRQLQLWIKLAPLACGGVLCGWLQAFGMLNFGDIFTSLISLVLSALVTVLLGGDTSTLFA